MKTLVIEDEPDTSRYVCNGLKEAGHNVTRCDNGLDGLHQALNETWDLIIIDRLLVQGKFLDEFSKQFQVDTGWRGTLR